MNEAGEYPLLNYPTLMLTLLRVASEGEADIDAALGRLRRHLDRAGEPLGLPVEEVRRRLGRARAYLAAAGLVQVDEAGHVSATARGRATLAEHPSGIDDSVLSEFPEFRAFLRRSNARPESAEGEAGRGAFDTGYAAFALGKTPADNPHDFDTAEHFAWENGWYEALDEAEEHHGL